MADIEQFEGQTPAWCPGCGNFNILLAFKQAMVELGLEPHQFAMVSGVGQSSKLPHYTMGNIFNGLHGRALPVATGIRLANHHIPVIAIAGDGDCYGEGGNHFLHTARRNVNVTLFVHDNQIYGLTKGQASPTSMEGMVTKAQPYGVLLEPLNPVALAVALDVSFVARGFAGNSKFLTGLMVEAVRHQGFSLVDILQPCVSFNRLNTFGWYKEHIIEIGGDHDPTDREAAFRLATASEDKIPNGIIYRNQRPTLEEQIPVLASNEPLVRQKFYAEDAARELEGFY